MSSYLTCTVSQAREFNATLPHHFVSLNQLLDERSVSHSDVVVAGFPELSESKESWNVIELTYSSLRARSDQLATYLTLFSDLSARSPESTEDRIVALLSPSCVDFLIALFALTRLGYGVLLIAPQNTQDAIVHLCRSTSSTHLIYHPTMSHRRRDALSELSFVEMPSRSTYFDSFGQPLEYARDFKEDADRTAIIMHTSGSTNMPKPIYQSHRIWTEPLPCMPGPAAFTTTPLFHGGICDFLRSFNAMSTTYFYSSLYSITAKNIVHSLNACKEVGGFLSVPYILQLLNENEAGRALLKDMKIVSTGGAPLGKDLGDDMVRRGVKLISRMGSSECSFLMSSERDFAVDEAWSWLRNSSPVGWELLLFEETGDSGLFELVVGKDWPTRVVSNREDGSFATGDLYTKHPTVQHAWQYFGRSDDMVVLTNGKKVLAGPIEASLRSAPAIDEAIVFGASRPTLGVLIVPSALPRVDHSAIIKAVQELNKISASHQEILDQMIVILPVDSTFPKASKGTVLRPKALDKFRDIIEEVYSRLESGRVRGDAGDVTVKDNDLTEYVRTAVRHGLPNSEDEIRDDDDLFVAGVTSLKASQIRGTLHQVLPPGAADLPHNVVFEFPSIRRLTELLRQLRYGKGTKTASQDELKLMRRLVESIGTFPEISDPMAFKIDDASRPVVVITGATGSLGAHLVNQFLIGTDFDIITLVRAENDVHATERVDDALESRGLGGLSSSQSHLRLQCFASDLSRLELGLQDGAYREVASKATVIIHSAWSVNFVASLESFANTHLRGLRNLLEFTARCTRPARFVFCSSVASVLNISASSPDSAVQSPLVIPEVISQTGATAKPMGYARSKWVAEQICKNAHSSGYLSGRVAVARIGQLCGDTQKGVWNENEGWPMLISTARDVACLPMLDEHPSWLPVDIAARVLVEICTSETWKSENSSADPPVFHLINTNVSTSWTDILVYLKESGLEFTSVSPAEWLERLNGIANSSLSVSGGKNLRLLDLWNKQYGIVKVDGEHDGISDNDVVFDASRVMEVSNSMRNLTPVSLALVKKCVEYWTSCGCL